MKTIGYILAALVGYKLLTGKTIQFLPIAGTVPGGSAPGGATAAADSIAPDTVDNRGTLTGTNAAPNGSAQYFQSGYNDPASAVAAFVPARGDGAYADNGLFVIA